MTKFDEIKRRDTDDPVRLTQMAQDRHYLIDCLERLRNTAEGALLTYPRPDGGQVFDLWLGEMRHEVLVTRGYPSYKTKPSPSRWRRLLHRGK